MLDRIAHARYRFAHLPLVLALLPGGCGGAISDADIYVNEAAITGGQQVRAGTNRAIVAIQTVGMLVCSGTLVSHRMVLTAGHCLEPFVDRTHRAGDPITAEQLRAAGGLTVSFGASLDDAQRVDIEAIRAWRHPDYDGQRYDHDLAALLLAEDSPVAPVPMRLSPFSNAFVGRTVRIAGFGDTGEGAAGTLREGETVVDSYDDRTFSYAPGAAHACSGDSGGPVLMSFFGTEYLVGVTSRGSDDCASGAINTRIDAYQPFIEDALERSNAAGTQLPLASPSGQDGVEASARSFVGNGCSLAGRPSSAAVAPLLVIALVLLGGRLRRRWACRSRCVARRPAAIAGARARTHRRIRRPGLAR